MKRLAILALALVCSAVQALAQPADTWDDHYERSFPLPGFKFKNYDQQRSWVEHPQSRFNIYVMPVGVMFHGDRAEPTMEIDLGVRFNRFFYAGAETGVNFMTSKVLPAGSGDDVHPYVPLALNVKGLLPIGQRFCPFISGSAGGYFGIQDRKMEGVNGFYSNIRAGIEYNRMCLSAGYSIIKLPAEFKGNFQIHFGIRLGR